MPLYKYECEECGCVFEVFQHTSDIQEQNCVECAHVTSKRLMPFFQNRVLLGAKDNFNQRIVPEINRISNKISKGSDKDFLDITGDK